MKLTLRNLPTIFYTLLSVSLFCSSSFASSEDVYTFSNGNQLIVKKHSDGNSEIVMHDVSAIDFTNKKQGVFREKGYGKFAFLTDSYHVEKVGGELRPTYILFKLDTMLLVAFENGNINLVDPFIEAEKGKIDLKTIYTNSANKEGWLAIAYKFGEAERTLITNDQSQSRNLFSEFKDLKSINVNKNNVEFQDGKELKTFPLYESDLSNNNYNEGTSTDKGKSADYSLKEPYSNNLPAIIDPEAKTEGKPQANNEVKGEEAESTKWYEEVDLLGLTAKGGLIHDVDKAAKENVITHLLDIETSSVVVVGEAGAGKSTLITSIIYDLLSNNVPDVLKNHKVYKVSKSGLTAGTKYRGQFEERIKEMKDMSEKENIIWVLNDIHTLKRAGNHEGQPDGTFDMLAEKMSEGTVKILGETTTHDYFDTFEDPRIQRLLPAVNLEPLSEEKINPAIKTYISAKYDVELNDSLIKFLRDTVDKFDVVNSSISKYMDLVRKVMARRVFDNLDFNISESDITDAAHKYYRVDSREIDKSQYKQLYLDLEQNLKDKLIGQTGLKKAILEATLQVLTDSYDQSKPRYFVLLDGPRGLGKTEVVKILEETLVLPVHRISMGQYKTAKFGDIEDIKLQIFQAMKKNPQSILFFDEIDKAPIAIQDGLLDVFDSRKFHVRVGNHGSARTVSVDISRSHVLFGSNAGSDYIIERNSSSSARSIGFTTKPDVNETLGEIDPAAHRNAIEESGKISVPFLSRIVKVIAAIPPDQSDFKEVLRLHMKKAVAEIEEASKVRFSLDKTTEESLLDAMNEKYFRENRDNRVFEHINDEIRTPFSLSRLDNMDEKYFDVSFRDGQAQFVPSQSTCRFVFH